MTPDGNGRSIQERAQGGVDDQLGMFDRVIEDAALEALLEDREVKRLTKSEANTAYASAHDRVKTRISEEALEPGDVIRCGRFRIKMTHVEGGAVAFETSGSDRLYIGTLD